LAFRTGREGTSKMTTDLKASFVRQSNVAWCDANAPEGLLSDSTRAKCLFDAAYFALLANAPDEARQAVVHHPDGAFIRSECLRLALPADTGARFAGTEFSPLDEERPDKQALHQWASEVRARLL